jgi:hypothetical protein
MCFSSSSVAFSMVTKVPCEHQGWHAKSERQDPCNVSTLRPEISRACCTDEVIIAHIPSTLLTCEMHVPPRRESYCRPSLRHCRPSLRLCRHKDQLICRGIMLSSSRAENDGCVSPPIPNSLVAEQRAGLVFLSRRGEMICRVVRSSGCSQPEQSQLGGSS